MQRKSRAINNYSYDAYQKTDSFVFYALLTVKCDKD